MGEEARTALLIAAGLAIVCLGAASFAAKDASTEAALLRFLCADVDVEDGHSGLVGDLQVPFLAWFKSTAHVLEKVGGESRSLAPGCFIVRQFVAFSIGARFNSPDMEEVARHRLKS